jgi:hypothetical protein
MNKRESQDGRRRPGTLRIGNHEIHAPGPWADLVERVTAEDAAYFEAHPGETVYRRPYVSGELGPLVVPKAANNEELRTEVRLLGPGVRTRRVVRLKFPPFHGVN